MSIEHLEVRYGDLIGVADVSLEVPEGGIVALLGSNGAGKTTTLNAVGRLIPTSGGSIRFLGEEIGGRPAYAIVRRGLALSPEGWRLFASQTVEANLRLGATVLADRGRVAGLMEEVFELFPRLKERRRQQAGTMSGGERQMLAVGRALMSAPRLLMLDEPSLGLAPAIVETMYEAFGRLHAAGLTILLAEQSVELALEFAQEATVLQVGRSVLSGRLRCWRRIRRCSGSIWGWGDAAFVCGGGLGVVQDRVLVVRGAGGADRAAASGGGWRSGAGSGSGGSCMR